MAAKKSEKYPHKWPDGTYHSIPWDQTKRAQTTGTLLPPPPGSYDPALDSTERAAGRGLEDLTSDVNYGKAVNLSNYETGLKQAQTGNTRSLSDLLSARERGETDYGTTIAGVKRDFTNLAASQAGAQRKSGTQLGGAVEQAKQKRTANEALARAPIDTAFSRFMADSKTSEDRVGEDYQAQQGALGLNYTRADEPLTNQLTRARRENKFFGLDTAAARQFSASQLGIPALFTPGPMPTVKAVGETLTAGPGVPGTKKRRKGRTVTYTNSVTGP